MQRKPKPDNRTAADINDEESAFEIIELAIDDINVLTRAFRVINTICEELSANPDEAPPSEELHGIPEHLMH
jgi:hypothetical protein